MTDKDAAKQTMEELFEAVKAKDYKYDAVVCFSGGKDSTYLLWMMKEIYDLNVLAVSVNHPFLNDVAKANIDKIPGIIGVNHIWTEVDPFLFNTFIKEGLDVWRYTKLSANIGCQLCGFFHHTLPINIAKAEGAPILIHGEDPAQVIGVQLHSANPAPLSELFYQIFKKIVPTTMYDPYLQGEVVEMAPLTFLPYDHREIREKLNDLGLLNLSESNSVNTNCTAFHFFAFLAFKYHGMFPYQKFIEHGLEHGYATTLDHVLDTDRNMSEERTIEVLADYERTLNAIANGENFTTELPKDVVTGMCKIHNYASTFGVDLQEEVD